MKYQIKCAEPEQKSMFYSDCEPAQRNACVGHARMDFGSGNEFHTTWWGNRVDLNIESFMNDLNYVVNDLRSGILKNRNEMQRVCSEKQSLPLDGSYGFSVETDDHLFLLRCRLLPLVGGILAADFVAAATTSCCRPERGNYDCYMYCYDKRELALAQSQEQGETQSPEMSL